jgi:hypothetical protein
MASRLRRRIPVIVSTRGSAAGVGAASWVGSTAPVGPEWLIPVATYDLGTVSPGASIPLTGLYDANGGDPSFTFVSGQTISGTSVTMVVDADTGAITAPMAGASYLVTVGLQASTAADDWTDRSTAAGVVWAHRFNDQQTDNFCDEPNGSWGTASIISSGGIIGDGCLRLATPAGRFPSQRWSRPLAPMPADAVYGYSADINNAGLPTVPAQTWFGSNMNTRLFNACGGFFTHANYYNTAIESVPVVAGTQPRRFVYAGPFWIQYRMYAHASVFASPEVTAKKMMVEAYGTSSNSSEYVQGLRSDTSPPQTMYHYSDVGATSLATASHTWPADTWVTVMFKITPGVHGVANAGVQLKIAAYGATSWTTLLDRTDIVWNYNSPGIYPPNGGGNAMPFGWNTFRFTTFNGGTPTPLVNGYTVDYDQVICSTQEIALPAL